MSNFPPRLALAQTPTPLQLLSRLSAQSPGPRIWVKRDDLTGGVESGNKIRKLEFVLAQAQAEGADTIITCGGIQSNHCRATAILAARLGLKCHLLLRGEPEGVADGNLLLDELTGASINFFRPAYFQQNQQRLAQEALASYRAAGAKPYFIPTGASDEVGLWGYVRACAELKEDFAQHNINPGHIVCATGSGGTQAGLIAGNALFSLGATVWGVCACDSEAYFQAKVSEDLQRWVKRYNMPEVLAQQPCHSLEQYIGPGYARAGQEVFDTIKLVARLEGLVLDPVYTGKAFYGMLQERQAGRFAGADDIVFIHTGGVYGLFPQREALFANTRN